MSEAYFERFTELVLGALMTVLLFVSTITVLSAYILTQNMFFYYAYIGAVGFSFYYVLQYARQFRGFKETVAQGLLFPKANNEANYEPLNLEVEDLPLKVCLLYRNGYGFQSIKEQLGLSHSEEAKRLLIKGLDVLLQNYEERIN